MSLNAQDLKGHFQHSLLFFHLITDSEGRIIHANDISASKIIVPTANTTSCTYLTDLIDPNDLGKLSAVIQKLRAHEEEMVNAEFMFQGRQAGYMKICWEVTGIWKDREHSSLYNWLGIEEHQSKTVFEEMGRTLEDIRERFKAYEFSTIGIWKIVMNEPMSLELSEGELMEHCNSHAVIADCNQRTAEIYGYSHPSDLIGKPVREIMDLKDSRIKGYIREFISGNYRSSNQEYRDKNRSGNDIHLLLNITGILENEKLVRLWGTIQDITLLKNAEHQLRQSEIFYRTLISHSLDGLLLSREGGTISFVSPSVERILGYSIMDLINTSVFELIHPDDRRIADYIFAVSRKQQITHEFTNIRLSQKSGAWVWCMVRAHSLLAEPGVGSMILYFSDNTERKEAEDALVASEKRFRMLLENVSAGVLLFDPEGTMVLSNPTAVHLLDLKAEEVIGKSGLVDYDIIHEDGSRFAIDEYPIFISLKEKKEVKNVVMGIARTSFADRVWILLNSTPVLDEHGELQYVITSYSNITEHRKLTQKLNEQELNKQKQLLQVMIDAQERERMEIGRELHDNISQHLTITRLHLEVARDLAEHDLSDSIQMAHKSLLDIVNEIRKLSHSLVPPSINDIGLVASVQDLCDGLKHSNSFQVDFRHDEFDEGLLPDNMRLMIYRIIQEQVNNILRHSEANRVFISLQVMDDSLLLFVEDNGKGFDPRQVNRGIGFLNIRNRAGLFGGKVSVDSNPGKGCLVEVEIPLKKEVDGEIY